MNKAIEKCSALCLPTANRKKAGANPFLSMEQDEKWASDKKYLDMAECFESQEESSKNQGKRLYRLDRLISAPAAVNNNNNR